MSQVVLHPEGFLELARSPGFTAELRRVGEIVRANAANKAPTSKAGSHGRRPGYLRSQIKVLSRVDTLGAYADIVTEAATPKGFRYGTYWEHRRHYLLQAVNERQM